MCRRKKKIRPYFLVGNLICATGVERVCITCHSVLPFLRDRESYASWDVFFLVHGAKRFKMVSLRRNVCVLSLTVKELSQMGAE